MLQKCYEETAAVEFRLMHSAQQTLIHSKQMLTKRDTKQPANKLSLILLISNLLIYLQT